MKFKRLEIADIIEISPEKIKDNRGYFMETFRNDKLNSFLGYSVNFCQENETKSNYGVVRGLHYQIGTSCQAKLVRVTSGAVLDVVVDIRKDSPTFGKYISIELSAENRKMLFIPKGFAHGFMVLRDNTIFSYKVDNYYNPEDERGIIYNDKDLNIDWKISKDRIKLSKKDSNLPPLRKINCL